MVPQTNSKPCSIFVCVLNDISQSGYIYYFMQFTSSSMLMLLIRHVDALPKYDMFMCFNMHEHVWKYVTYVMFYQIWSFIIRIMAGS